MSVLYLPLSARVRRPFVFAPSLFVFLVCASACTFPAPTAAQSRIDLALAREYFEEARQVAAQSDTLWRAPVQGALLLVDPATRQLVANVADSAGLLTASEGVYVGTWPENEPVANTAVTFGARRYAMVLWPLPNDRATRLQLLFHESFHRIQPVLDLPGDNPDNLHLNTTAGRIWIRLEWRALAEALLRDGADRVRALRDALAFRAQRLATAPAARAEEQALLINEGLSEYTGWRMNGDPDSLLARRVALALMLRERQESLSRSFAYAAGPAYGILLDMSGTAWRGTLTAASDLPALLTTAYRLGRIDTTDMVRRSDRYGGVIVRADETDQTERRNEAERRYRLRFMEGPTLTLPVADSFNYSFNPNDVFPLPGVGTVYGTSQIRDVWGSLRVTRNGVLLRRAADGRFTAVIVPAPAGVSTPLEGSGWRLTLADGWVVQAGARPGDWVVQRP